MASALPLTKLAGLVIKTLSKPLSKRIKHDFSRFQLTQRLLIGIGQTNHQITSRMTVWSAGYRVRSVSPLDEEKALKQGAEFIGESVVFLVSGGWVLYEYNLSVAKAEQKEEQKKLEAEAERKEFQSSLMRLEERLLRLEDAINNNSKNAQNSNEAAAATTTEVKSAPKGWSWRWWG